MNLDPTGRCAGPPGSEDNFLARPAMRQATPLSVPPLCPPRLREILHPIPTHDDSLLS